MPLSESSPFNPYSPPEADRGYLRATPLRPRRAFLAWIYAGLSGITFLAVLATHFVEYSADTAFLWELVKYFDAPIALVKSVIVFFWIHAAWTDVPARTRDELHVSPGKAVGFLFIPFVNIYWLFAMPRKLCTAIDRVLVDAGRAPAAPFAIALLASTLSLLHAILTKTTEGVPVLLSFAAAGSLWLLFMLRCDRARAEMLSISARR
jgi:hypothetical protein